MNGPFLGLGVVLAVLGLLFAFVVLATRVLPLIRWNRPVKWSTDPVPESWPKTVRAWFPLSRTLSPDHFDRLLRMIQVFVRDVRFEGAGGFEITDEVPVIIAAQACYLVVGLDGPFYPGTRVIVVYPSTFVPSRPDAVGHGAIKHAGTALLGESWTDGTVVLAWDSVVRGAANPKDGRNLIFHEFAHQFDQEDGDAGGIPPGMEPGALREWARVLEKRFTQLRAARERGKKTVLNHYGATNEGEFFAVALEAFYEKPTQLKRAKPDLYKQLCAMLKRDPATELKRYEREKGR